VTISAPFANVFSAFNEGLEKGPNSLAAPSAAQPASGAETGDLDPATLLQLLQALEAEGGQVPFSAFAKRLPGDSVASLTATIRLMKEGWVEFVGDVSETSNVRLTGQGREMLATLRGSTAAI